MPADQRRRTSTEVERCFQANLDAPGKARRFVAEVLEEVCAAGVLDDAEFITSELTTNAVVHTGDAFVVAVSADERRVRITVSDRSHSLPVIRNATTEDGGGRGLTLVDCIADRWGINKTPEGKGIWVELIQRD
jgi:anti-sigma regulatory factor (Ser/Thr protein kinase)